MIEFLQNYGLWIALAGVFVAMHRFGVGCGGGGHHQERPPETAQIPGNEPKAEKPSRANVKSNGCCH